MRGSNDLYSHFRQIDGDVAGTSTSEVINARSFVQCTVNLRTLFTRNRQHVSFLQDHFCGFSYDITEIGNIWTFCNFWEEIQEVHFPASSGRDTCKWKVHPV
ncbi:uncharacterized protein [Rhodnius prolixus]|uniref:uncharacterized protein n=1 Tax=Rhodnius prolixus TaxID=13249 RepID=UPI003D188717